MRDIRVVLVLISFAAVSGCGDSCTYASDGACDEGGPGSEYSLCDPGTDCADCGPSGGGTASRCAELKTKYTPGSLVGRLLERVEAVSLAGV